MIVSIKLNHRLLSHQHPVDSSSSSSSLTLVPLSGQLCSTTNRPPSNLLFPARPDFIFNYQAVLMMPPPPGRDRPLLKSHRSDLAKSCYWSGLIRPLILLILTHQLGYVPPIGPSAKLFEQLDFFFRQFINSFYKPLTLNLPPAKTSSPLRISAASPAHRKIRLAKAFKCSSLVDLSDSSIQHHHDPPSFYLNRSNASRTIPRSHLFIGQFSQTVSQSELQQLSMLAQSQMERSHNCSSEDGLDGDQRHKRYYLVNSYRAKLASLVVLKAQSTYSAWQVDADAEDALEPLEDLLDWDSSTRKI